MILPGRALGIFQKTRTKHLKHSQNLKHLLKIRQVSKLRLRTDNEEEYCNKMSGNFLAKNGIVYETNVLYSPQQNGVAERLNHTVIEKARSVLQGAGLGSRTGVKQL